MDITDFFGSIRFDAVYSAAFPTSRYPKGIGTILTALCCLDDVLPQSAPTSPALSNLVMLHFDNSFGKWCADHGFAFTRYCDDITVSGDEPLGAAYGKAKALLRDMGFSLSEKKTHFVTNASRQTVTGLTVNEKVRVPSEYKRKLRQELYYVHRYGLSDVIVRQKLDAYFEPDAPTYGCRRYYRNLMGRLNFVLSIEPDNAYFRQAKETLFADGYNTDIPLNA